MTSTCLTCSTCHPNQPAGTTYQAPPAGYTPWPAAPDMTSPVHRPARSAGHQSGGERFSGYTTFQPAPGEPHAVHQPAPPAGYTTWQPAPDTTYPAYPAVDEERPLWSPEPLGLDLKAGRKARKARRSQPAEPSSSGWSSQPPVRKRRRALWWTLIVVGVATLIGATGFVAVGLPNSTTHGTTRAGGGVGPRPVNPTPTARTSAPATRPAGTPATGDVTLVSALVGPDTLGGYTAHLAVANSGPKRSDYTINLSLESKDRAIQFATTVVTATDVEPGQTARVEAVFKPSSGVDGNAKVRVVTVRRTISPS